MKEITKEIVRKVMAEKTCAVRKEKEAFKDAMQKKYEVPFPEEYMSEDEREHSSQIESRYLELLDALVDFLDCQIVSEKRKNDQIIKFFTIDYLEDDGTEVERQYWITGRYYYSCTIVGHTSGHAHRISESAFWSAYEEKIGM